jgi:hypothetical protein
MPRGGRKRGADTHKVDRDIVPWLEHLRRVAKRERGWKPFTTIRWFIAPVAPLWGKSINAVTHRLYQKMKSGRYGKWEPPPGIRWSKFTLRPQEKPEPPEEPPIDSDGSSKSKSRIP